MGSYLDILRDHCISSKPKVYLEIGVGYGKSLRSAYCSAHRPSRIIVVDPDMSHIDPKSYSNVEFHEMTSDEFFKPQGSQDLLIDTAFIDGMHLFEYALRDFINCEKHSHKDSRIFFHDVLPRSAATVNREGADKKYGTVTGAWNGDIWKIIPILKTYRPDLVCKVHNVRDGLLEVTNLDPASRTLEDAYTCIVDEYRDLDYRKYMYGQTKSDLMIFCTAAPMDKYLERVSVWYDCLKQRIPDADFYCGVDGQINSSWKKPEGITFVELTPPLGRCPVGETVPKGHRPKGFPGWRRSYGELLDIAVRKGYSYITHIENDVTIRNWDKVLKYIRKPGLYSSMCPNYNFVESAFQILNDNESVKKLRNKYTTDEGIQEHVVLEQYLKTYPFEYVFTSTRLHDRRSFIDPATVDIVAQSYPE